MDTQRRPETPLQASGSLASGADRELLARYQATGDQDALGEIVRRHARLVYAACLRVLGDHHAAEDAAQAAFVTFCRRARHLSDEGSLRAWMYETARLTAVVHRRNVAIRRKHEEQAMREPGRSIPSSAAADDDLMAGLDQALGRLAPKLREAVLLRYMEGLSQEEAAAELRCPAGTISARASRGLEKLRHYFGKRGFTISAGALAAALGEAQAVELPVGLASRALAVCTGEAAMSDSTLAAVKGVERAMLWSKVKCSAPVLFCLALAVGGLVVGLRAADRGREAGGERAARMAPAPVAAPVGSTNKPAAESAPAAKPAEEPKGVKPDLAKPVWVILQCDKAPPPKMTAEQKKAVGGLLQGPFFGLPTGVGFALEQGRVTRPWLSCLTWWGAGHGPDGRTWSHAPLAWIHAGQDLRESFEAVEAVLAGDRITASMKGTCASSMMHLDPATARFDVTVTGTVVGAKIEGQWKGTVAGFPCQGTCVGAILQAASAALDPANAVYQIVSGQQNIGVVVEVRGGKGVSGLARRIRVPGIESSALLTQAHEVDAAGLTVTVAAPAAAGRGARLNGTIKVAGLGDLDLKDLAVTPTGYGGNTICVGQNVSGGTFREKGDLGVRAYSIDDPVALQWKRWMQATYAGTVPVESAVAEASRREAETLVCLPPPQQAAQFLHRYVGFEPSFIYPPWFDFKPVEGAKRYRFTVGQATFEAETPTAWLSPIWKDLPLDGHAVTLTALDAAGKPLGETQKRQFRKRAPFGGEMARGIGDHDLAREIALRYPRVLRDRYYGPICALWAVWSPPHDQIKAIAFRTVHHPFAFLAGYATDPAERTAARPLALAWGKMMGIRESLSYFGCTDDYFSLGFLQQGLNDRLTAYELAGDQAGLEAAFRYGGMQTRLIQPNGSWTWIYCGGNFSDPDAKRLIYAPFKTCGRASMDHDGALYANFYGRLRKITGDDRHRDSELKAVHWLMHNGIRTGYWEHQEQQSDPSDTYLANTMAIECLEYLLERAPTTSANGALAEDLARYIEDRWIDWGPVSRIRGGTMTNSGRLPMAVNYLRLWRATGKALYRAKAEALFHSYLIEHDPVLGFPTSGSLSGGFSIVFNRYLAEYDGPVWALRYLELRRALDQAPPAKPLPPENAVTVLRLQHGVAKAEPIGLYLNLQLQRLASPSPQRAADPVFLYLDAQGGKVRHAIATTPTWDGPILDYPQPGRLHWQEGMALFHSVDASKLTVGPKGIQGEVVVHLKAPLPDRQPVATTYRIEAALDGRMLAGRHDGGRVDGELRPLAAPKAERLWFEMDRAVLGGEPWQNWAVAQMDLPGVAAKKDRAPRWLGNGNAGWSADVESSDIKVTDASVGGTMKATVTYFGFRDGLKDDAAYHRRTFDEGLSFLAYWNTSEKHFGRPTPYKPEHGPHYIKYTPLGDQVEYFTSSKPVTPGQYEYRLDGRRLGDVVAGTVTVKGPDGKERASQFLGGVE